ncbi:LPS translocon maturation chaperone LptM [Chitinimonas sp. BJB300]|nr:lipopeptide [Chitinimonas sp. BJB300]
MRLVILCLLVCLLNACGYKGALYLPGSDKTTNTSKAQP